MIQAMTKHTRSFLCQVGLLGLILTNVSMPSLSATIIENGPRNNTHTLTTFGENGSPSFVPLFGQTFIAPNTRAGSITVELFHRETNSQASTYNDMTFNLLLTALDTTGAGNLPGNVLYESTPQTLAPGADWTTFTVDLAQTPLVTGVQYAFVLDAFSHIDGQYEQTGVGGNRDNGGYADGYFFALSVNQSLFSEPDFKALVTPDEQRAYVFSHATTGAGCLVCFNDLGQAQDMAFRLAFDSAPVPLPPTLWLLGSGLMGLFSIARRNG